MTKIEKLERATSDHRYAIQRIGELEKEMTQLRQQLSDLRRSLRIATGQEKAPEPYEHHY